MEKGYCVKCKAKRGMEGAKQVEMKGRGGKRYAMKGTCEKCGTGMYKILGMAGGTGAAKKAAPKKAAKKPAPKKAAKKPVKKAPKKAAKKPAKKKRK